MRKFTRFNFFSVLDSARSSTCVTTSAIHPCDLVWCGRVGYEKPDGRRRQGNGALTFSQVHRSQTSLLPRSAPLAEMLKSSHPSTHLPREGRDYSPGRRLSRKSLEMKIHVTFCDMGKLLFSPIFSVQCIPVIMPSDIVPNRI